VQVKAINRRPCSGNWLLSAVVGCSRIDPENTKADSRAEPASRTSVSRGSRESINFFFDLELLLFHPPDHNVIGPRSGHLLANSAIELPVLLCEFVEMCG